ncbi:MAG TPA: RNA polymerase sigma-70 factor [Gemmatimonadaceae bacterium]|nr:RNA polymerase sigma-70 factor [Gemmatimonadaceae bacterium]
MSDADLLLRLRAGDAAAFEAVFRAWYAPLVRLAEGMLHDRGAAEEVVQDVMLELWRRRESLDSSGTPQAYLFRSARNRALNQLRHRRVQARTEPQLVAEVPAIPRADAVAGAEELAEAVRQAIESLPPRCREVFELSRMHGLRYTEIAQTLGVSIKAVEAQMGRALRTLRERLAPWLPGGDTL